MRQQETWDHVSSEKGNMNKPYNYLERISMCSARMWQGGLKRTLVVSLSLEDTVKSLWRSQQLEFAGQVRVLWKRELRTERKLWRPTDGSLQVFNQVLISRPM